MKKILLFIIMTVSLHSVQLHSLSITNIWKTYKKKLYIATGGIGCIIGIYALYRRHSKYIARENIKAIIQDMNENNRTHDDQGRKRLLRQNGRILSPRVNQLIDSYINLHDTPIPTTYRGIADLITDQNLPNKRHMELIEILRANGQKTMKTLWVYRELKENKGQEIIDHVTNQ